MKIQRLFPLLACVAATATNPALGQEPSWSADDEAGVRAAAMNYMEGALNVDADRVARGVHPELNKVIVVTPRGSDRQVLSYNTHSTLVEAVRGMGDQLAEVPKDVELTIFDIGHGLAVVRCVGAPWYDFAQLAKVNGEWSIVNVLWARNQLQTEGQGRNTEDDRSAVEAAALDYIEGAYSGDAERMGRALHPELNKVLLTESRATGVQFLYKMGWSNLVEGTRAGLGLVDEGERAIEVEIYDVSHDMAMAKVSSLRYIDYLQLGKVDGEWKIINVLWVPNPASSGQGG
jgi:hypothetical protein